MRPRGLALVSSILLSALTVVPTVGFVAAPVGAAAPPAATSAYVSLPTPTRLLDTRVDQGGIALGPGGVATVTVTGAAPNGTTLPTAGDTVAVVLNVTVVGPAAVGFWTAYPHGAVRPLAASLYVDERTSMYRERLTIPNLVTVPVGPDGMVDIFSQGGGHVVVDMLGAYRTSDATAAGRLQPLPKPNRILDTRSGGYMAPDSAMTVQVPAGAAASAAVLSVTTIAVGAGFWTMYPTGTARPIAANINSMHGLHIVANQVIVPLDGDGNFDVYSQSGGHVIVDLVGLVTGASATVSTDGLFVPLAAPTRFLDTREAALNPLGGARMALPGWGVEVGVGSNPLIGRSDVAAVAVNLTAVDPLQQGYVSLTPAGTNAPDAKSRDTATVTVVRAGQVVPSHAIVGTSPRGFDVFTLNGAHLVADVAGYYIGAPVPAPFAPPANAVGATPGCIGFAANPVQEVVLGSSRAVVAKAQQRLLELGFWVSGTDGSYGLTTSQAVMAFQKWKGMPRTTQIDEATAVALNTAQCRPVPTVAVGQPDRDRQGPSDHVRHQGRRDAVGVERVDGRELLLHGDRPQDGRPDRGHRDHADRRLQRLPGVGRRSLRRVARHVVPAAVLRRRRRGPRLQQRAELPRVARLRPGHEPGDGHAVGDERDADGRARRRPRLIIGRSASGRSSTSS